MHVVTCNAKTMKKTFIILIGFLCLISCKSEGKEKNLRDQRVETALLPQPTNNDTLDVENYDLIFLRPSEEEFNRLVEVHGEDSGLNEVDSDFGFYASKVDDSLSSTDLKVHFATEKIIKMDSEKGMIIINRDEIENAAFGIIFNHTKCYPIIEFGVMTDHEIYQRIMDQKEKCR